MLRKLCVASLFAFAAITVTANANEFEDSVLLARKCHKEDHCEDQRDCRKCCKPKGKFPLYGQFAITDLFISHVDTNAKILLNSTLQTEGFVLNPDGSIQLVGAKKDQLYLFRIEFVAVSTHIPRLSIDIPGLRQELTTVHISEDTEVPNEFIFYCTASYYTVLSPNAVISLTNIGTPISLIGSATSSTSSITLQVNQIPKSLD